MDRAKEIIEKILYVTLATTDSNDQPWNSPVYSAFDKELNFYWCSDKEAQHSRNLKNNNKIFLVIYDSTAPEGAGEGVYIQALAEELEGEDATLSALAVLDSRVGKSYQRKFSDFSGAAPRRLYKARSQKVWVNEDENDKDGNFVKDIRKELDMSALKGMFK